MFGEFLYFLPLARVCVQDEECPKANKDNRGPGAELAEDGFGGFPARGGVVSAAGEKKKKKKKKGAAWSGGFAPPGRVANPRSVSKGSANDSCFLVAWCLHVMLCVLYCYVPPPPSPSRVMLQARRRTRRTMTRCQSESSPTPRG